MAEVHPEAARRFRLAVEATVFRIGVAALLVVTVWAWVDVIARLV